MIFFNFLQRNELIFLNCFNKMIQIYSFATHNTSGLVNFKNSISTFDGWNLEIIGTGMKWEGFITKIKIFIKKLRDDFNSNKNYLTILLDGYDVLCIKNADGFKEKFDKFFPNKIVIGYETLCNKNFNCHVPKNWQKYHNEQKKYANSGCIFGYTKNLYEMCNWIMNNLNKYKFIDDQIAISYYMDAFPDKIKLDINNIFVYNDNWATSGKIDCKESMVKIKNLKNQPYFIHFPGFMKYPSAFIISNFNFGKAPKNYINVGKKILKENFITHQPIDNKVFNFNMIAIYILLSILIIVIIILSIFLAIKK